MLNILEFYQVCQELSNLFEGILPITTKYWPAGHCPDSPWFEPPELLLPSWIIWTPSVWPSPPCQDCRTCRCHICGNRKITIKLSQTEKLKHQKVKTGLTLILGLIWWETFLLHSECPAKFLSRGCSPDGILRCGPLCEVNLATVVFVEKPDVVVYYIDKVNRHSSQRYI